MKMQFSLYLKTNGNLEIIEAKNEGKAFQAACEKFGANNFGEIRRYFEGEFSRQNKKYYLENAISNVTKHLHKQNRRGFKKKA